MKLSTRFFGVLASLLLLWAPTAFSQPYASYDHGRKVYYAPSATQLLVQFTDAATLARRGNSPVLLGVKAVKVLTALPGVALLEVGADSPLATVPQLVAALRRDVDVVQAVPVLLNAAGKPFGGVTDQFIVKLNATTTLDDLQGLLKQTGAVLHHPYEFEAHTYFLSVDKSKGDALTMANRFYESGLCEYAEPNFVLFVEPTGTPNDPLYNQQWALNNTGQTGGTPDADMDVAEAWDITTGASSVRVAVLDNGVDLSHLDLINQLNPGYDATGGGNNGGIVTTNDLHGTACAGIVAAQGNNGLGVAGVAYSCRVVPVRVYVGYGSDDVTTAGWMAAGVDWAWQYNRADVLSLSFRTTQGQQLITNAIHRAVTQGRNNLGCLVLTSAGNNNGALEFPGSVPDAIAVGGSENTDHRTYDSNYGTGLDIVAPGEGIATTDVQGTGGYNTTGDYTFFRGTSAATPNAAGVAALVLSVAPGLTAIQARQILESSTDKVNTGDYTYSLGAGENPNLTWNNQMGYGRVNAYNAVMQAQQAVCNPAVAGSYYNGSGYYSMQGFNYVTSGSVSISVSTPVGANCTFTISPSNFTITKQGPTRAYFQIGPASSPSQQRAQVDIVTQTSCGTSSGSFQFYVPGYNYQAAPNPATDELTVTAIDESSSTTFTSASARTSAASGSTPPYEAALYDSFGQQVRLVKSAQGKAVLDVRNLPNGLYTLRVGQGKDAFTEHIQIT